MFFTTNMIVVTTWLLVGGATKELGEGIEPNEIKEGDTIKGG